MPKKAQMLQEINAENGNGVLLMVQMDATPDTLQLVVATTVYDPQVDGLRDQSRYIIRALGVQEHQLSMGMFNSMSIKEKDQHPLLYVYNTPPTGMFFRGTPENPNELVLDIFQSYASVFGPWRQIPEYLNMSKPLLSLVSDGGDVLGEMPKPLAQQMEKTLQHHKLETKVIEGERHKEMPYMKALLLDESFIVAMDFSVDELGKI